jgi:hypothetical protein
VLSYLPLDEELHAHDNKVSRTKRSQSRAAIDFTPDDLIRYLPQGIPPIYFWRVSLYTLKDGHPDRVQVVLVNATTGAAREK